MGCCDEKLEKSCCGNEGKKDGKTTEKEACCDTKDSKSCCEDMDKTEETGKSCCSDKKSCC